MTANATAPVDPSRIVLRAAVPADADVLGRICYDAFAAIADEHNFSHDFPTLEMAVETLSSMIADPTVFSVVAEIDGRIAGSNFLREANAISGVGPISVDPAVQNGTVGRTLMDAVLERSVSRGFPGVRLVQAAYHRRSLALYMKLGFAVREPLVCLQGEPVRVAIPGCAVRVAMPDDRADGDRLCARVHGHTRSGELAAAIAHGTARVVERAGRITGYATGFGYSWHAVAEMNDDLQALIGAGETILGPGLLVPSRNGELVRWCFAHGLRVTQTLTLMSIGLYNEPAGAWMPSIFY